MDTTKYQESRDLYYERKNLPFHDPNVIFNMSGWLKIYQMEDVVPLVQAVQNQFKQFWKLFQIDANVHNSLPSMAMAAMFANYDESLPLCFTFAPKHDADIIYINPYPRILEKNPKTGKLCKRHLWEKIQ